MEKFGDVRRAQDLLCDATFSMLYRRGKTTRMDEDRRRELSLRLNNTHEPPSNFKSESITMSAILSSRVTDWVGNKQR